MGHIVNGCCKDRNHSFSGEKTANVKKGDVIECYCGMVEAVIIATKNGNVVFKTRWKNG